MQWGQIKTLFIISFLVLDLFLLQQFMDKQSQQGGTLEEDTVEDRLNEQNIGISEVPEEYSSPSFISASRSTYSEEDQEQLEELENQNYTLVDEDLLVSEFQEPVDVDTSDSDTIIDAVQENVPFSSQYSYWGMNEEQDTVLFFQKANNQTVYYNEGGLIVLFVEDGQITRYAQTRLGDVETLDEDKSLIAPLNTVELLLNEGNISSGDEITNISIGYHSKANLDPDDNNTLQVLAPTWKVTVNDEDDYFVNAADGVILEITESDFITSTLDNMSSLISGENDVIINPDEENPDEDTSGQSNNDGENDASGGEAENTSEADDESTN
ncbi:two-component system regulatory protein YycI [Thalassobacillus sp. CUG 92003]|uniref:two-component system regulatory protein YycI n=1 Tax=Thalassobacillus sp. CUG 92003 TaxID=2736641 RepID=UPI0015E7CD7B|nr:two-component system regulatory protein YycI [Thalassobacillus sp. CUG 92003]